jgi:hypothetical protein
MSAKPENSFIHGVHRYVTCYKEKMNNPYRGGTPDVYYEGNRNCLWVEYKFILVPARDTSFILPELSDLQKHWLRRCHANTGRARVVIGCKAGGVMMQHPDQWEDYTTVRDFKDALLDRKALGAMIDALCLTLPTSTPQPRC